MTFDIEKLSAEIHQLYCKEYERQTGEQYWTNGDYSKLSETTKEYDRNIARFIQQQLQAAEQQNAQLRADLAQRDAECVKLEGELQNEIMNSENRCMKCKKEGIEFADGDGNLHRIYYDEGDPSVGIFPGWCCDTVLSTSSGKDMLENMRLMQEALEKVATERPLTGPLNLSDLDMQDIAREALAKVKGHKNEWGAW